LEETPHSPTIPRSSIKLTTGRFEILFVSSRTPTSFCLSRVLPAIPTAVRRTPVASKIERCAKVRAHCWKRPNHRPRKVRLVIAPEPALRVFVQNLRELFHSGDAAQLHLQSSPAAFWPDVFVERGLPWRRFVESAGYHILALLFIWAGSRFLALQPQVTPRPTFTHADVVYYSPSEYLPPLDTRRPDFGSRPEGRSRIVGSAHYFSAARSRQPCANYRHTSQHSVAGRGCFAEHGCLVGQTADADCTCASRARVGNLKARAADGSLSDRAPHQMWTTHRRNNLQAPQPAVISAAARAGSGFQPARRRNEHRAQHGDCSRSAAFGGGTARAACTLRRSARTFSTGDRSGHLRWVRLEVRAPAGWSRLACIPRWARRPPWSQAIGGGVSRLLRKVIAERPGAPGASAGASNKDGSEAGKKSNGNLPSGLYVGATTNATSPVAGDPAAKPSSGNSVKSETAGWSPRAARFAGCAARRRQQNLGGGARRFWRAQSLFAQPQHARI